MSREWDILPSILGQPDDDAGLFIGVNQGEGVDTQFVLFSRCKDKNNEETIEEVTTAYNWSEFMTNIATNFGDICEINPNSLTIEDLLDQVQTTPWNIQTRGVVIKKVRDMIKDLNVIAHHLAELNIMMVAETYPLNIYDSEYTTISVKFSEIL
jgi:hypothetical protein